MKKKLLYVLLLSAASTHFTHAQLLKKLKEKVNNSVDKALNGPGSQSTADNSSQAASGSGSGQVQVDFAKYRINTQPALDPSVIKERYHQFQEQYACYETKDSEIVGKAVIYAGDQQSEGGGYTGNTAAYVFENGKRVQRTSIDDIENQKAVLAEAYKRYDWPYHYDKDDADQEKAANAEMKAFKSVLGSQADFMPHGFWESKNRSKFYGIAMMLTDPQQYFLISSGGKKIKLPSIASNLITNIDFSKAAVFGFANTNDLYFADGHIIKNAANIAGHGWTWLDPSGNNYLSADENAGAYINGKKIVDKGVNPGEIWCNADASKWCYFANEGGAGNAEGDLVFSDGADIPNAIHPVQIVLNDKNYIVWFSYKNVTDGDLLLCKKLL